MDGRIVIFMVLSLTLTTRSSLADEQLPSAILSPDETEVVTFSVDANGNDTTLQLNCSGVGTLSWYRGEPPNAEDLSGFTMLLDNNLLMLTITPVTNNTDASNAGVPYYCVANNTLGRARSRTVLVKYAFFTGFEAENTTTEIVVRTGRAVAMSCGVRSAAPPPKYVWFRNNMTINVPEMSNRVITLDDGATLVIYDLTDQDVDEFEYTCGVTNARMFDTEISTRIFKLKKNVTFSSNFIAYRPPKSVIVTTTELSNGITFYYIGTTTTNDQTELLGSGQFTIDNPTLSATIDEEPTTQLRLSLGSAGLQVAGSVVDFDITIIEPLVVIDRPSNISTIYHRFTDESINFTCNATGTGTQLQWFRNTEKFEVINSSTLVFDRVSLSNSGVYQCFWEESEDGTFKLDTWALIVEDPVPPNSFAFSSSAEPLLANPNRTIVPTNASVSLTLRFIADDVASITWFRNETETGEITEIMFANNPLYSISGPNRTEMEDWFRVVFTINTVNNLTSGFYYAEIDDGRTSVVTSPIWFVSEEVALQIVSVSLSPHNCLLEGVVNTLQCVVRGLPDPKVVFEITSTESVECTDNSSCEIMSKLEGLVTTTDLVYNSVSSKDEGSYTCFASNSISDLRKSLPLNYTGIQLRFCRSPNITSNPGPMITRTEGSDITLSCTVSSVPLPSAKWYRDGVELVEVPNRIDFKAIDINGVLEVTLMNVSINDTGIYTCTFINMYIPDEISYSTNLTVIREVITTTEPPTATVAVWIPVAAGVGGGLALLLVLAVILVVCLCCCLVRSNQKKGTYTTRGISMNDYTDGRGNVDKNSDEEDEAAKHPEAFQPQYESLPVVRPAVPPDYKPSPAYGNQFPGQNDEFDMMKPPIPDDNQGSYQYHPQQFFQGDNGGVAIHGSMMQGLQGPPMSAGPPMGSTMGLQQPRFEDFMSDDEKFV